MKRLVCLAGVCAGMVLALPGCSPSSAPETSSVATSSPPAAALPAVSTAVAFDKVKGRWARTDGDYMLELRSMGSNGTVTAAYFNPNPINVGNAIATNDSGALKVVVTLQDANYPGCIYNLTYLPEQDQLAGRYYQASMQQTFEVIFERVKP